MIAIDFAGFFIDEQKYNKYTSFILAFPRSVLASLPVDVARTRAYGVAIFLWFLGTIYLLSIRDRFQK